MNIVGSALTAYYGGPEAAAAWNYDFNRAMGASSNAALKSAGITYAVSAATYGASAIVSPYIQVLTQATIGGIAAEAQGGKFANGFISAGIGAAMAIGGRGIQNPYYRVAVAAVVGGTTSTIMGGKFANGAATAAFASIITSAMKGEFGSGKVSYNVSGKRGKLENEDALGIKPKGDIDSMLEEGVKVAKGMDNFQGKIADDYKADNRYGIVVDGNVKMFDSFDEANSYAGKYNGQWANAHHYKGGIVLYKTAFYSGVMQHMSGRINLSSMENVMLNLAHEGYHYSQWNAGRVQNHSFSLRAYERAIVDEYKGG
ncbi:hypothetical protein [uncultured Shewanella sp.]|uniref:hypothetical protein n=1 Tax=uncultured Shewanella sp. TaxID=173975 RepID=UPI0026335412|nr:hypothetical protein [uncultured Shewanella sp.]